MRILSYNVGKLVSVVCEALTLTLPAFCQTNTVADSLVKPGTLENCVRYALTHQPSRRQALLDEEITEREISTKLADWYPQLSFGFNIQHYPQIPVSIVQGSPVRVSLANSSGSQFTVTQTLFNRDVLLASSTAHDVRQQALQQTVNTSIDIVINVSKAFYAALVTQQQIAVLDEDIVRLEQGLKDAYDQYKGGIVDKIDFKRATIALNNAEAERTQNEEQLKARLAALKEQMGYPPDSLLAPESDSTEMVRDASIDTNQPLNIENRIEYQILQTQRRLQEANLRYYEWSFLPSLSAFGSYNLSYQSDEMSRLFFHDYPNSVLGLQLSFPIFEGGKRLQEIQQASLELDRFEYTLVALRNALNTEFVQAMASYKSSVHTYNVLSTNLDLARDVYQTIELQYKAGVKTYLEVITAETDLRTAQVNRTNALYLVLSSKLDVQKALGAIHY